MPKRSAEDDSIGDIHLKKQRLAHNTTHDPLDSVDLLDNQRSAHNARRSPFLKLPAELRNKIYEMVLCGKYLHIMQESTSTTDVQWIHTVCSEHSEIDNVLRKMGNVLFGTTDQENDSNDASSSLTIPTEPCHLCDLDGDASIRERPYKTELKPINLALLFTCKQIHSDARLLPYSGNTFVFRRQPEFEAQNFLTYALTARQRDAVIRVQYTQPEPERRRHGREFMMASMAMAEVLTMVSR